MTRLEPWKIGLEPREVQVGDLKSTGWSLVDWRLVSLSRVGALHYIVLDLLERRGFKSSLFLINTIIYSYCSPCILIISDLTGKNKN